MKSSHKILVGFLILIGAVASIGGFLYTKRIASAYDLAKIIVEPAEKNPEPKKEFVPVDARIKKLKDRGDGARLVATAKENETFLRLAFADNATLIVSATSTEEGEEVRQIFSLALDGGRALIEESEKYLATSSHRPSHSNVGTTCFSKEDKSGAIDIYCRKRGDVEAIHLTEHDGNEDIKEPAISPGGDWVAFQVDDTRSKEKMSGTIWKIGMNRAGIQQLTRGADDRYPTWSADGKTLFFQRRSAGENWDMYRMTESGANPEPILRTYDEDEMWPTEAGKDQLIFSTGPIGEKMRLRLLDIESKSGRWLTSGAYGSETHPSISPDGHLVSFLAPINLEEPELLGIWVLELTE